MGIKKAEVHDTLRQPWRENEKVKLGYVDEVSVEWLRQFKGNVRRKNNDEMENLKHSIQTEGLKEPITLIVGLTTKLVYLGEGNHRLDVFTELGIEKIPTTVWMYERAVHNNGEYSSIEYPHLTFPNNPFWYSLAVRPSKIFTEYKIVHPLRK